MLWILWFFKFVSDWIRTIVVNYASRCIYALRYSLVKGYTAFGFEQWGCMHACSCEYIKISIV